MKAHTDGIWKVLRTEKDGHEALLIAVSSDGGYNIIAEIAGIGGYLETEANAKIIAASPFLFEGHKDILAWLEHNGFPQDHPLAVVSRNAITKASAI